MQVGDLENIKYAEDLPFPIKLDKDTRTGKTLTQFRSEGALKKAVNEQNVDLVEDVVLFVNAATDGYEQPIHFKLTLQWVDEVRRTHKGVITKNLKNKHNENLQVIQQHQQCQPEPQANAR